jgi:hypothetical protein
MALGVVQEASGFDNNLHLHLVAALSATEASKGEQI